MTFYFLHLFAMHYCVFVIIGSNTNIETRVAEALDPFAEDLRVAPYRIHFSHDDVVRMASHYQLSPSNLHLLAEKIEDWTGRTGGVDRDGLYRLCDFNPDGRWDWYEIGGRWDGHIPYSRQNTARAATLAQAAYLEKCLPYFVLTPNGEWIEHERYYFADDPRNPCCEQISEDDWLALVRDTLKRWPDHYVVCVDIHS
jgi:hypothetical protein